MDVSRALDEVVSLLDVAVSDSIVCLLRARKDWLERVAFSAVDANVMTPRLTGEAWDILRHECLTRDDFTCQGCGAVATRQNVHHIIPLYRGGKNEINNLITLCDNCHARIHPWLLDGAA